MVGEMKMLFAVRKDLDMGKGKIAAQVAHAAVSCALYASKHDKRNFKAWMDQGQKKIVIRVNDLDSLMALGKRLRELGVHICEVTDAGYTQVPTGSLTCFGTSPVEAELIDPVTSEYPLL
ncbi:MAG: peptidyl-tRNA hydrolase Pth2 [Candidatus Thermoplasmatota archaeon]|nr:peptidyl-tRNA hydrolase Pth2 [Candidatus Thermoplasmatota archaeon]MCL5665382.1 peptidyl-tRNA hydrolase Pth2 [Candidatus Thermoplasmatota archaeon]